MKRKILVNAYFAKNLGDDLFLKILFERYKNVEWYLLGAGSEYRGIFKDISNVFIYCDKYPRVTYKLFKNLRFREFDAMVYIGGSIFIESASHKYHMTNRKYVVNQFKKQNKKVYIIGSNFGPYYNEKFLLDYKKIFRDCEDICFREKMSYELFNDLDAVRVAPDVIFNLKEKNDKNFNNVVGISVIDLSEKEELKAYREEYENKIRDIIEYYIDEGYKVALLSFCEREGDVKAVDSIVNNLEVDYKKNIEIIKYNGDIDKFIKIFKEMRIIVGTRFHSIILGLLFGQDVVPLVYSEKTSNVLKDLGLKDSYIHIKDISNLNIKSIKELGKKNKLVNDYAIVESTKQFLKLDEILEK